MDTIASESHAVSSSLAEMPEEGSVNSNSASIQNSPSDSPCSAITPPPAALSFFDHTNVQGLSGSPSNEQKSDSKPDPDLVSVWVKKGWKYYDQCKYEIALEYFKKAAEKDEPRAWGALANMYQKGRGVVADEDEAKRLYDLIINAAKQEIAAAQHVLGVMYYLGDGVPKDESQARQYFELAANQGYARGLHALGACYANGSGVKKDYKKAGELFKQAAEQGFADSQDALGILYKKDLIFEPYTYIKSATYKSLDLRNYEEACKCFRVAAEQDHAPAQNNLGEMYLRGYRPRFSSFRLRDGDDEKKAPDPEEARKWFERAAAQEYAPAQNNLGEMYYFGRVIPKDYSYAYMWFERAANNGSMKAQYSLGRMYEQGLGVAKNDEKACYCFERAAMQDFVDAQKKLAAIHKALITSLEAYLAEQNVSPTFFSMAIDACKSAFGEIPKEIRISATKSLINKLQGKDPQKKFSKIEINALLSGDLAAIIKPHPMVVERIVDDWCDDTLFTEDPDNPDNHLLSSMNGVTFG